MGTGFDDVDTLEVGSVKKINDANCCISDTFSRLFTRLRCFLRSSHVALFSIRTLISGILGTVWILQLLY